MSYIKPSSTHHSFPNSFHFKLFSPSLPAYNQHLMITRCKYEVYKPNSKYYMVLSTTISTFVILLELSYYEETQGIPGWE